MRLTGEGEEIELRGIMMGAIGTFAEAVGSDSFRPYFQDMMTQAFAAIDTSSSRLRECSFLFFGVMSHVFGNEFAPYRDLDRVVPSLIISLKQEENDEAEVGKSYCSSHGCYRLYLEILQSTLQELWQHFLLGLLRSQLSQCRMVPR